MKIIKRNGAEEDFDNNKIVVAVAKANTAAGKNKLSLEQIKDIADYVEYKCVKLNRAVSVEEIQDMVENQIMSTGAFELAKDYVRYRYQRSLIRKANTTDNRILSLIECNNEDVKQENSNKNPTVNSVQRDYMAGEVSKDLTKRMLLPQDIVEADKEGIIHFHDSDYFAQHMHNCDLVNLEDMLQNGTVISGTLIEKPHSFSTASAWPIWLPLWTYPERKYTRRSRRRLRPLAACLPRKPYTKWWKTGSARRLPRVSRPSSIRSSR